MHEREGGQHDVVAGDYSTYNGLRIGLLARHTYNDSFKEFAKEKGFIRTILRREAALKSPNGARSGTFRR